MADNLSITREQLEQLDEYDRKLQVDQNFQQERLTHITQQEYLQNQQNQQAGAQEDFNINIIMAGGSFDTEKMYEPSLANIKELADSDDYRHSDKKRRSLCLWNRMIRKKSKSTVS